jgi:hypothetical protein
MSRKSQPKRPPLTMARFLAMSDAEKEAVYRESEKIRPDDATQPLTAGQKASRRRFAATVGAGRQSARPKVGTRPTRVQVTVERSLLSEADGYAKRKGLNRSQVIAHALQRLLSA